MSKHTCSLRVRDDRYNGEMDFCGEPAVIKFGETWLCKFHADEHDTNAIKRKKEILDELKQIREWQKIKKGSVYGKKSYAGR